MLTPITMLSFIVLLPMVPAYLLFRALPSTGNVEGKLQGLEIKLGGAFAGYFALVFLVLHTESIWNPPPPPPAAYVWHLSGQVVDVNGNPVEPLDLKDFALDPSTFSTLPGGRFDMIISTQPQDGGGTKYPDLVVSHGSFAPHPIPLDPAKLDPKIIQDLGITEDAVHRQITIEHIRLQNPAYNASGPPPERVEEIASNHQ